MKRKSILIGAMLPLCLGLPLLAGGGAGHDGYDWGHFVPWAVNAAIFFGGLGYILRKPVADFFGSRHQEIQDSLSKAEISREEAARKLEEIEQMVANLDVEVKDIITQAEADAAREKDRLIGLAKQDVEKIRSQAKAEVENLRRSAVGELKKFLADLAVAEAEKIVSGTMTDEERKKLFVDFTTRLGAKS